MKKIFKSIVISILEWEARAVLAKYKPKIVGVTGSVGKTSTKDAIFSVLSTTYHTRKSQKSFNSDIGIPLTILGLQNGWNDPLIWLENICKGLWQVIFPHSYPEWLVLEVGADRPGDIQKVTQWLKPDVAVVTAFAKVPVHIEFFSGRDAVIREKRYLVEALKHDGVLVANGDDADVMKMKEHTKNISVVYGTDGASDIVASGYEVYYAENKEIAGLTFKVAYEDNVIPVVIAGTLGVQHVYAALAAMAVGLSQKINLVQAAQALLHHETPNGRMKLIPGIKNTLLIDDTYNSSPVAATAALKTLKDIKKRKHKIAVLGDMLELGKHSAEEHYELGKLAAASADILVTVGIRARKIAEGALDAGMDEKYIFQCDDSREAATLVHDMVKEGDVVLLKGSQSIRVERVTYALLADPLRAGEVLIRQDKEWGQR